MPHGSSTQQFLALCKKNFIVKARNKKATAYEILCTLYFLGIAIILVTANQKQLSSYPALPALPLTAPSPLGTEQLATPLTCLYSESSTACSTFIARLPSW